MPAIKKKIKDMTKEDAQKICDKYDVCCDECPLYIGFFSIYCLSDIISGSEKYANYEVEVEDDKEKN